MRMFLMVVMFFGSRTKINGGKQREYISLQESDDELEHKHKDGERHRYDRDAQPKSRIDFTKNKDEAEERKRYDVPCEDVGKKSNHQNERTDEYAEDFDRS